MPCGARWTTVGAVRELCAHIVVSRSLGTLPPASAFTDILSLKGNHGLNPETGWTFDSEPPARDPDTVTMLSQTTFCLGKRNGDIDPARPHGLFVDDSRVVSEWCLTVDGVDLEPMTVAEHRPFHATFVGRARLRADRPDSTLLVERHRYIGNGMREDIVVRNLAGEAAAPRLVLTAAADFADLFQVKASRVEPATAITLVNEVDGLHIEHGTQPTSTRVRVRGDDTPQLDDGAFTFTPTIDAHKTWSVSIEVTTFVDGAARKPAFRLEAAVDDAEPMRRSATWYANCPEMSMSNPGVLSTLRMSRHDLDGLRIFPDDGGAPTLAAGAPWFMTVFGRDAIFGALMALPLDPSITTGTLHTLARHQGTVTNPLNEEEPGRILHEIRHGAEALATLGGEAVYYGAADSTQLFVVLLAEAMRWGLPEADLRELLPAADRALEWVQAAVEQGDGFVGYRRSTDAGLVSQGWKDSPNSICFADGRIPVAPIALCEVQAYVYAAYVGRADIARALGDHAADQRWRSAAADFKAEFNRRFWLPDHGYYAVALDGDGTPVDALTSNIGHTLWSGIADADKAKSVAAHLLSPQLFTGWGIRTLASSMPHYNPMSYHRGSIWPWDTAVSAAGLMRYGFVDEARRVAVALLEAADAFNGRLPELFCGFDRDGGVYRRPVPFAAACWPQTESATTPLYLLRTLLRLNPDLPNGVVDLQPALPASMVPFRTEGVPLGTNRLTIEVDDDRVSVTGLPAGVQVPETPR